MTQEFEKALSKALSISGKKHFSGWGFKVAFLMVDIVGKSAIKANLEKQISIEGRQWKGF